MWVKCLKGENIIFEEGNYYKFELINPDIIVLIDEQGNRVGFRLYDPFFSKHFKIMASQKRGTKWELYYQK